MTRPETVARDRARELLEGVDRDDAGELTRLDRVALAQAWATLAVADETESGARVLGVLLAGITRQVVALATGVEQGLRKVSRR